MTSRSRSSEGEFFSLLGPSGCGKTTTLRMIGGFEEVTDGTVFLGDEDVTGLPPFKRDDEHGLPELRALPPPLGLREHRLRPATAEDRRASEIRRQVAAMLKLVELPGYEERKPSQLSGGQQQRIALARALINHPRVLLLDEPLGALDLKLRKQMQVELKRIQSEIGITFIFVTHDQEEAMTMSDRIAVMRHGKIEQLGAARGALRAPADRVRGGVPRREQPARRRGDRQGRSLRRAPPGRRHDAARAGGGRERRGDRVRIGVRPEKLRVLRHRRRAPRARVTAIDANAIEGIVLDASYIGVSTQYIIETKDGHRLTVYAQNIETSGAGEVLARRTAGPADLEAAAHVCHPRSGSACSQ